jgi:transposase-like protein/rubredoxin
VLYTPIINCQFEIIYYCLKENIRQQEMLEKYRELTRSLIEERNRWTTHSRAPTVSKPLDQPYPHMEIDALPVIKKVHDLDYRLILTYSEELGSPIKPIRGRTRAKQLSEKEQCPRCHAPHQYLYINSKKTGQRLCKVCKHTHIPGKESEKPRLIRCPHCMGALEKIKTREGFEIFKCKKKACPYYQQRMREIHRDSYLKATYLADSQGLKLHYIYRDFQKEFQPLAKETPVKPTVDLSRIHKSQHVVSLAMTYHINYALSARKTAAILYDVHQVKVSHQTILNWAEVISLWVKPFTENYPYQLSDQFCGDETYIRIGGKWHYLLFFFDAVNKIILSDHISAHRDTEAAIEALREALIKINHPEERDDINFIVDGNPIYLLAQQYFAKHDVPFDVTQVIGLTNGDDVSREYRWLKQTIERLNRSFKSDYRVTTGFKSLNGAEVRVTLFTTFYNFLRPHEALDYHVPVPIPEVQKQPHMPAKWLKIIELAQTYVQSVA